MIFRCHRDCSFHHHCRHGNLTDPLIRRVYLARKKRTEDIYAIKVLRKSDMIQKNQIKHVRVERNILARTQNDFVIKMYYAFQSKVCEPDHVIMSYNVISYELLFHASHY